MKKIKCRRCGEAYLQRTIAHNECTVAPEEDRCPYCGNVRERSFRKCYVNFRKEETKDEIQIEHEHL